MFQNLSKNRPEELMAEVRFNVHKFTKREKPDPNRVLIIGCFSEFGCEILGSMYCFHRILAENPGFYYVAMGWYGRAYLYRHLVDEFWEMKEEHMFLRDYARAFHNTSRNLARLEKQAGKLGRVVQSARLGNLAVGNGCQDCKHFWVDISGAISCPACKGDNLTKSLYGDVRYWKQRATRIPPPSREKLRQAGVYLGKNPVGVIARNRKTYGRNLQPDFYVRLIRLLEGRGYTPIWLGEKQTTLACPLPHVTDLSRLPEAADLELTLAIVSQVKFTVQFWTASTRLAGAMGTPYLLFESPEQLVGGGQEGYRLALCTMGRSKLALCQYLHAYNDNDGAIALVERCVREMEAGEWGDVVGLVDSLDLVGRMRASTLERFG